VRRLLSRHERGQATSEYALIAAALLGGAALSLLGFAPSAIEAYRAYFGGFYLVLGLPSP